MRRALVLLPLLLACGTSGRALPDAGLAGRDSAITDAAPLDADRPDAAVADAARPDAAILDASAPDAEVIDAGTLGRHEVLFLGNSYTYVNDLPAMYRALVGSLRPAPEPLQVDSVTAGGWRLSQHAADAANEAHRLFGLLGPEGPPWTQVILQEQSQIPGFEAGQADFEASRTAAAALGVRAAARGAPVVFFMTWGRRDGDSTNPGRFPDFSTMQTHLEAGYRALAEAARGAGAEVSIAPVGLAFAEVHAEVAAAGDPLDPAGLFYRLYAPDGSHPSRLGSYLAACVFAATHLGVDPTTLEYLPAGVTEPDAVRLRAAAQRAVLAFGG